MGLNTEKLNNIVLYIASHPEVRSLGDTKLYKLIYFSDVENLRECGESITGSEYIKYKHGPVPSRAEKSVKYLKKSGFIQTKLVKHGQYTRNAINALKEPDTSIFTSEELHGMDEICKTLGRKSAATLSRISHEQPAWVCAEMLQKMSQDLMMYGSEESPDGL